jgi:hypothetical protein
VPAFVQQVKRRLVARKSPRFAGIDGLEDLHVTTEGTCQAQRAFHTTGAIMSAAIIDLVFWIIVFVVFLYGFKWLQNRKKQKDAEKEK